MDGAASLKLRNWMLPVAASSSKDTWTAAPARCHGRSFRPTTGVSSLLTQAGAGGIRRHHHIVVHAEGWPMVVCRRRSLMDVPSPDDRSVVAPYRPPRGGNTKKGRIAPALCFLSDVVRRL